MAIVLVIAGLLISAAITIGSAQISSSRISATKERQTAIKNALTAFILRNNRVPCPAVPTWSELDAGYGIEAANLGACTGVPASGGVSVGIIPWKSLGLNNDGANDGYNNRFTYAVTTSQTNLTSRTISGMRGAIAIHSATPASAANQTNNCTPIGWTYNPCQAVVVILSHGELGRGAYRPNGGRIDMPDAGNVDELENTNSDSVFIDREYGSVFNDLLLALDPEDLLLPLISSGAIKSYRAQVENDFRIISGMAASIAVAGRNPPNPPGGRSYTLPSSLAAMNLPAVNTIDPWGQSYIYARVTSSIENSTANAVAFTITSYGPDNILGGDDIVETVMVSDMQALFSTYGW
jgi:type II secretory pathway pseudopilin PulG